MEIAAQRAARRLGASGEESREPRVPRLVVVALVLGFLWLVAFALYAGLGLGRPRLESFFDDGVYNGLRLLALGVCLARVARVPAERPAWLALALAEASWEAGDIYYTVALSRLEQPPYPSPADALYLAGYPACWIGLMLLVRGRAPELSRSVWLDGLTAALTTAALGAAVLFQAVLETTEGSPAAVATNLAYPLGDLLLLALLAGVFALTRWRPGRAWALIGAAFAVGSLADGVYLYEAAGGTYLEGTMLDVAWPAGSLLLACSAWQLERSPPIRLTGSRLLVTPALCGLVAVAVLTYDHWARLGFLPVGLAVATLLAVLARTGITFHENHRMLASISREATTDALTGLGNRRKLLGDLARQRSVGGEAEPRILLIFDLDGLKRYNDTYGHPAGDALLARLGGRLGEAVGEHGEAYRLGGDEFCVLAAIPPGGAEALVDAAAKALMEYGEVFSVGASFGAVFLPEEAGTPTQALRVADERLYVQKQSKPSRRQQMHELLVQLLFESAPDLQERQQGVAGLAIAVGRRLGLEADALDRIGRAAALHDIGKLALPDEIVHKRGPLDEREWAFVRTHTLIGQRLLTASHPLRDVASVVRASHERWDGTGYPDGLRGEAIPVAARIVAACDAFVAMTSERPHQAAMSAELAREEIRRCAGTQFDPVVADALCAELTARARSARG